MEADREQAIEGALAILDYGCDWGRYDEEAAAVREVVGDLEQLREVADRVRRGADSLFSSMPFAPPEAMGFQINAKLAGPLTELREWLDSHPPPKRSQ